MAGGVKRPANRLFQGLFESLVGFDNRERRLPQAMALTGLVVDARKGRGDGQEEGFFVITHHATHPIPQGFDRLQHTAFHSQVIGRKQGGHIEH